MTDAGTFSHPCEPLEDLLYSLEQVPGVSLDRGTGPAYALERLRSLYDHVRASLPLSVGDLVRVADGGRYGTSGWDVTGKAGVVHYLGWNPAGERWQALVELRAENPAPSGRTGDARVKLFSFDIAELEPVEQGEAADQKHRGRPERRS